MIVANAIRVGKKLYEEGNPFDAKIPKEQIKKLFQCGAFVVEKAKKVKKVLEDFSLLSAKQLVKLSIPKLLDAIPSLTDDQLTEVYDIENDKGDKARDDIISALEVALGLIEEE